VYKIATEPREFELIHEFNYETFAEEIPQHARNVNRKLVDKKHAENTYVICIAQNELAGMVAICGRRPFSLDEKLPQLDAYLPVGRRVCEIRLLAVKRRYRKTTVFLGLILRLSEIAKARGYDLALISGTTRQLKLYGHLGFFPFGPRVGKSGAEYQPMMLEWEKFENRIGTLISEQAGARKSVSFLPGPVEISAEVQRAFAEPPTSHRANEFCTLLLDTKKRLRSVTHANHVSLQLGSGTLANDIVGGQLSQREGVGLVLANGEFGDRLIEHARRWELDFHALRLEWGKRFDCKSIEVRLQSRPSWIWFAHCETSTGMLNDFETIASLCKAYGVDLCVDAISSLGTVPVDLSHAAFATGVSGKGFAAYPGLAIVFHRESGQSSTRRPLPAYLDLAAYAEESAVPFTQSSNLVRALHEALADVGDERFALLEKEGKELRDCLGALGYPLVSPSQCASPAVVTIAVPYGISARELSERIEAFGYSIAARSAYLVARNWIQIALMGRHSRAQLTDLMAVMREVAWSGERIRAA
jgi:aspartate aminotransferase-like enzyme